jgi:hypothetical protein
MTTIAAIAVALAAGTWFGIRWNEAKHRIDQMLQEVVMSTLEEWDKAKWDTELHEALDRDRWRWN